MKNSQIKKLLLEKLEEFLLKNRGNVMYAFNLAKSINKLGNFKECMEGYVDIQAHVAEHLSADLSCDGIKISEEDLEQTIFEEDMFDYEVGLVVTIGKKRFLVTESSKIFHRISNKEKE